MDTLTVTRLEADFRRLPLPEQVRLLERLKHIIGDQAVPLNPSPEPWLAAMAADPQIQHELAAIADDFAIADADGLESV